MHAYVCAALVNFSRDGRAWLLMTVERLTRLGLRQPLEEGWLSSIELSTYRPPTNCLPS
jgi:hypothetical protein